MKKLIHEYRFLIIGLLIPYIFIISSIFIKVNKDLTAPATITAVSNSIHIGDNDKYGVNTVSVYSYEKINLLSYLFGLANPYASIDDTYEYSITDSKTVYGSGKIQKDVSVYNSIIAGYRQAGYSQIINENSFKGYIIHVITTMTPDELKIGDVIIAFNGVRFTEAKTYNEFAYECSKLTYDDNAKYSITVIRNNEEQKLEIKKQFRINNNLPIVTVFGGSQGAETINKCFIEIINKKMNKEYQIIWAVGSKKYEEVRNNIKETYNASIVPYIYNMEEVLNLADLVVSRSGAMTITEVAKCGKPAIFIPYPYATENHQEYNAKVLANADAARIILDKDLNTSKLNQTINEIILDKVKLKQMGENAKKVSIKNVEEKIFNEIEKLIK